MPLVLAENEESESGITYADRTGVVYQYPPMYRKLIQPGERFIYYRGRKSKSGKRIPQVYFGAGLVGDVHLDPEDASRMRCNIIDYVPFSTLVPFKIGEREYLEMGGWRKGYFQRGVRRISEEEFERILAYAERSPQQQPSRESIAPFSRTPYASSEVAHQVDEFAMVASMALLQEKFPLASITRMPHNNPGFDILVESGTVSLYVEVKGTQRSHPSFFLSAGELRFSQTHAAQYLFLVLYEINLQTSSYEVFWHEGAITTETFALMPVQWQGSPVR